MKKLICIILLFLVLVCSTACVQEESDVLYQSENVVVTRLAPPEGNPITYYEFPGISLDYAYDRCPIILTATILDSTPVLVEFQYEGHDMTQYRTILQLKVHHVLRKSESFHIAEQKEHVVSVSYNEHTYDERLPVLAEGEQLLLFCLEPITDGTDPAEQFAYTDFTVYCHDDLMIERFGDFYMVPPLFQEWFSGAPTIEELLSLSEEELYSFVYEIPVDSFTLENSVISAVCERHSDPQWVFEFLLNLKKSKSDGMVYDVLRTFRLISCEQFEQKISDYK